MTQPHGNSDPPADRKRLVMIMGVQRSGTTALFEALATAPGVTARNESPDDEIYVDYFLRPESEIRDVLGSLPGTVLLKPVRESEVRSPRAVAAEYAAYDLRIVWLYRDPVNVFDSYVRRGWRTAQWVSARAFANEWQRRNATAVADATAGGVPLVVIRYEDLCFEPRLMPRLAKRLGLVVNTRFGADSAIGRQRQPEPVRRMIDGYTAEVRSRLDHLRAIRPAFETAAQADSSPATAACSMTSTAEYRQIFQTRDPASQHARWLAMGPIRRDVDTGTFVSLGYVASCAILRCSSPLLETPSLRVRQESDFTQREWECFFAGRRSTVTARLGAAAHHWITRLPIGRECNLLDQLFAFSVSAMAAWLDVSETLAEAIHGEMRGIYLGDGSMHPTPRWESLCDTLLQRGLIAELREGGLLERDDVLGFVADTAMRMLAVPSLVCNAIVAIADSPEALSVARHHPAMIPGIFADALRLVPMWFALKRRMTEATRLAEFVIPSDAVVEVFLATANRDPEVFQSPDQLRPTRPGPAPILTDTDAAPYSGLADNQPWGSSHVCFDVSVMVLERLLAGPVAMVFHTAPRSEILPMPNGDLLQVPRELLVALQPHSA